MLKKLLKSLNDLNYNRVDLERVELRNGKIILVLKPKILSNQVFAPNPYYDEGEKKNQLDRVHFEIKVSESSGSIKAEATFGNPLNHFTKGHSQIHCSMGNLFITKIEKAVHEVLTSDMKYITDSDRMGKLINNLESDEEREHVRSLIDGRIKSGKIEKAEKRKKEMLVAIERYEKSILNLGDING